ncbi:MAG: ATP-binding protein [Actinobacteria bacterium]|nr:ATP-binding protein [Actinomycetota bacterium]
MIYQPRVVDGELADRLRATGAVVIQGVKGCGKTETARQQTRSEITLDDSEMIRLRLELNPASILDGDLPRLIDEWQEQSRIWNLIRHKIDERKIAGQYVLTGSSVPSDDHSRHSGAARFSFLKMRPMTLFESSHSSGEVSFKELFARKKVQGTQSQLSIPELAKQIVIGGWPAHLGKDEKSGAIAAREYVKQICEIDGPRTSSFVKDPILFRRVLTSLARNISTEVTNEKIIGETIGGGKPVNRKSVLDVIASLERILVTEDLPTWLTHLRSRAILRKSSKRHFVDPSLAVAVLGGSSKRLLDDSEFFGLIFESLVIRDLRVYAQSIDADVFHYRDSNGLEVDVIVQLRDGTWGAFEVKLGSSKIDEGARNLLKLANEVDDKKVGKPSVLCVITASEIGGIREDGVVVLPIGSLGP